ncbi:MAG: hypothetical protein ACFN0U_01810, partial [Porphyromonas asaccharolytica]
MQDFNISRFIYHTKEYLKASARRVIYSSTDAGMKVAGNLLTILLVLSLMPFVMILLLFAGVAGINAWLELGWGWSFLIGAGVLLLLVVITLLLRKAIVRTISTSIYRKVYSSLAKLDDKLRPQPMASEEEDSSYIAHESKGTLTPTDEASTTQTR